MRLSIRLQQHGKRNHPYWWIVVAPQHKNIFGKNTEHIGFWSPRHGVNMKRQIILNMPKLLYWLGNGAVPTPKVHHFLHLFGVLPKQWHYIKTAAEKAEIESKKTPYEVLTGKAKILEDRRRKRNQRTELHHHQFHKLENKSMFPNKLKQILDGKRHQANFESAVMRQMLQENDFERYNRIAQLSNNPEETKSFSSRAKDLNDKIRKLKAELTLSEKQSSQTNLVLKSKLIQNINILQSNLRDLDIQKKSLRLPEDPVNEEQYISQDYLENKIKYQLITKKIKEHEHELQNISDLQKPVTVAEFALKLDEFQQTYPPKQRASKSDLYQISEHIFASRALYFETMTKMDLLALDQKQFKKLIYEFPDDMDNPHLKFENQFDHDEEGKQNDMTFIKAREFNAISPQLFLKTVIERDDVFLPSSRPTHPRPDMTSYLPEQRYDPIDINKLEVLHMDPLDPQEELEKYHRKKIEGQSIEERKEADRQKRMERLRMLTYN